MKKFGLYNPGIYNEQILSNLGIAILRTITPSNEKRSESSLRVKRSTIKDYSKDLRKKFLKDLANFKIIKAKRGISENNYEANYDEIYKILGYENEFEFKRDFLKGKIPTNAEVGVALGILIHNYFRKRTKIRNENIQEIKEQNQDFDENSMENVINKLNDPKKFNRVSPAYATNIIRAINDTKQQVMLNLYFANLGENKHIIPDGDIGKGTKEALNSVNNHKNLEIYPKGENEEIKNFQKNIQKEIFLEWKNNILEILNNEIKNSIEKNISLDENTINFLKNSFISSAESQFITYETIKDFLESKNKTHLLEKIENGFKAYIENGEFFSEKNISKNNEKTFNFKDILKIISNPYLLKEEKNGNFSDEEIFELQKKLVENIIIANEIIISTDFSAPLLFQKSKSKNEANSLKRATSFKGMI